MSKRFVLNLNQQSNGDYEVHEDGCYYFPVSYFDDLGGHLSCSGAVFEAKRKHPYKRINGCGHCAKGCHRR